VSENIQSAKEKKARAEPKQETGTPKADAGAGPKPGAPGKKAKRGPEREPVTVESRLRKLAANSWFEEAAGNIRADALKKKREDRKKDGPKLSSAQLASVADELEEVQRALNPLLEKKEELSRMLVAHWAHTGIEEIQTALGNTRITTSMSLCVDPEPIEESLTQPQWRQITRRILQAPLLLALAMKEKRFQPIIGRAIRATNVKVSVTPPSSRTAKKGESRDED
jgi:hypothetical protein